MQKLVREYLNEMKSRRKKRRRTGIAAILLIVMVVGGVIGVLTQYGVAMTGNVKCGMDEHQHSEACYSSETACGLQEQAGHTHTDACYQTETTLVCTEEEDAGHTHTEDCYTEDGTLVCGQEESAGHTHTDGCYQTESVLVCGQEESEGHTHTEECTQSQITCGKEEHTHTDQCYIDTEAGVEDASVWEAQYKDVDWKDAWGEDLVTAAQKQIGYKENADNYTVAEDGSRKGYTRYGQFVGDVYRDWNATFVNFCMYYAGMTASGIFPDEMEGNPAPKLYPEGLTDSAKWIEEFKKINEQDEKYEEYLACLTEAEDYEPSVGDIAFFENKKEGGVVLTDGEKEIWMGVVSSYNKEENKIKVIEGDSAGEVKENSYSTDSEYLKSYLKITELDQVYRNDIEETESEAEADTEEKAEADDQETGAAELRKTPRTQNSEEVGEHKAYVDSISMTKITDGTEPFDGDDEEGNDSDPGNKKVRTYDAVTYDFVVETKMFTESTYLEEARIKLEFVLPLTEKEAVFDQSAMKWMDTTPGFTPELKIEERTIEISGKQETRNCQVLTCYKKLTKSEGNQAVVPGRFGENVTINVKAMKNGDEFAPILSAAMADGAWGHCNTHDKDEKKSVTADKVTVTAAPRYNIAVNGAGSYKSVFDFNTGDDQAANKDIGSFTGRVMKVGITLQLYNNNGAKGVKGIELPDENQPITFDLELESKYEITQADPPNDHTKGEILAVTDNYTPLLWSYYGNRWIDYGNTDDHERILLESLGCSPLAPYADGGGDNACYKSGSWNAVQNTQSEKKNTISVTVSGFEIDIDKMPTKNGDRGADRYGNYEGKYIGCFSAGAMWIVQPFNKAGERSDYDETDGKYDIVNEYGEGSFTTLVTAKNMKVNSVRPAEVTDEMETTDNMASSGLQLTLPGSMHNRVRYADAVNMGNGVGIVDNRNGRDFALPGTDIGLQGGFSYHTQFERKNELYWGTNLTRFDGEAIELKDGDWTNVSSGGAPLGKECIDIYYAAKTDGTNWTGNKAQREKEMMETLEDNLVYYKNLDDLKRYAGQDGKEGVCVGILYCFKEAAPINGADPYYIVQHQAKVRDTAQVGQTYIVISTARVWTRENFEKANKVKEDIANWIKSNGNSGYTINLDDFPGGHIRSANCGDGWTDYTQTIYADDGSGVIKEHNSDWSHYGDTLLIIGCKTGITKNLLQKDEISGSTKETFNLDNNQREVDFKLQPSAVFDTRQSNPTLEKKVILRIVDILPEYLTYIEGTAVQGGEYEQNEIAGIRGTVTGASRKLEPTIGTKTITKSDGKEIEVQTLTWEFEAKVGEDVEPIYYSTEIDRSVPSGTTQFLNTVSISAPPDDVRDICQDNGNYSEAGFSVSRGSADAYGKYGKQKYVEIDGKIDYTIFYDNNGSNESKVSMVDRMPVNIEDPDGNTSGGNNQDSLDNEGNKGTGSISNFTGTYEVTSWKLNTKRLDDVERIEIYYTTQESEKNRPQAELTEDNIKSWVSNETGGWKKANIATDGKISMSGSDVGQNAKIPYIWAVYGTLKSGESATISMQIQLIPDKEHHLEEETELFVNALYVNDTPYEWKTKTIRRVLEGLTWMDYDRNGVQGPDSDEERVNGIQVALFKLKEGGNPAEESDYEPVTYPGTNDKIIIRTGEMVNVQGTGKDTDAPKKYQSADSSVESTGRYKFYNLPEGTFAVKFTDGSRFVKWDATGVHMGDGEGKEMIDSDGVPVYFGEDTLDRTIILGIDMPSAERITADVYESKYHDSGFYPCAVLNLQKVDVDNLNQSLSGAEFTVMRDDGGLVTFEGSPGSYKAIENINEFGKVQQCYIAYATDTEYVIGATFMAGPVQLQKFYGTPQQKWEMRLESDGSYSFSTFDNNGAKGFLNIDGGNQTNLYLWNDVSAQYNEKWKISSTGEGVFNIWAAWDTCNDKVIDLPGNEKGDNKNLQIYQENNTEAQKWKIIPIKETAEDLQTTLTVGNDGKLKIRNLLPGSYTITEIKSPEGYTLLKDPIEVTVNRDQDGTVTVMNHDMVIENGNAGWKVKNSKIYELPSAGGTGIYWYMFGGVLLMSAAALMTYRNKRREVLRS